MVAERVGVWGSSYSAGHVLYIAAVDRRVKAVVAQVRFFIILSRQGEMYGFIYLVSYIYTHRLKPPGKVKTDISLFLSLPHTIKKTPRSPWLTATPTSPASRVLT